MEAVCKQRGDAVEVAEGGGGDRRSSKGRTTISSRMTTRHTQEQQQTRQPELPATYQSAQQPLKWQQQDEKGCEGEGGGLWAWALVGVHKLAGQTGKQAQLTSHKMTGCQ